MTDRQFDYIVKSIREGNIESFVHQRNSSSYSNNGKPSPSNQQAIPVAGIFAIVFGVLGIFTIGFILSPIALLLSITSIMNRQFVLGGIGLICSIVGIIISPTLWIVIGSVFINFFSR